MTRLDFLGNLQQYVSNFPDADLVSGANAIASMSIDLAQAGVDAASALAQTRARVPGGVRLGTYLSGYGTRARTESYPREALPPVRGYRYSGRTYDGVSEIDFGDFRTVEAFSAALADEVRCRRAWAGHLFLDNRAHPSSDGRAPGGPRPPTWDQTTRALWLLRGKLAGVKLVANIGMAAWAVPPQDIEHLAGAVDGVGLEMFCEKQECRLHPARVLAEFANVRRMLELGLEIWIFATQFDARVAGDFEREQAQLAALALLVREPAGRLFVSRSYFQPAADWCGWPERLGAGGALRQIGASLLVRSFERGAVQFDCATQRATVTIQ